MHARFIAMFAAIVVAVFMAAPASAADTTTFEAGQMWTVKGSDMRIVVGRVEPFGGGKSAVSVSVLDVPCPPTAGCTTTTVAHAPFDSDVLAASVDKLVATGVQPAPQFDQGYANWKQAKGGVFTVPVSKLPDLLFHAIGNAQLKNE
ncbi:MAG TPA: hypothetical protein VJ476_03705 [Rhizomicrobium sp.]|nr:hypothetical protein [Rhizomicrobium sp.]